MDVKLGIGVERIFDFSFAKVIRENLIAIKAVILSPASENLKGSQCQTVTRIDDGIVVVPAVGEARSGIERLVTFQCTLVNKPVCFQT